MSDVTFQPAPLYAMDTAFKSRDYNYRYPLRTRCEMAAELGFVDTYLTLLSDEAWEDLKNVDTVSKEHGLGVAAVYVMPDIDKIEAPSEMEKVDRALAYLPQNAILELSFFKGQNSVYEEGDPKVQAAAFRYIEEVLRRVEKTGHTVSLYPHINFWLARLEHATSICEAFKHPQLGMNFNVVHWFFSDGWALAERLEPAAPYLKLATFTGIPKLPENDAPRCVPLDEGILDLSSVLAILRSSGKYHGKVGFQGWSWQGDPYENLQRSMKYFRGIEQRFHRHPEWS